MYSFFVWLPLFNVIFVRFVPVVVSVSIINPFLLAEGYSIVWLYQSVYSFTCYFQFGVIKIKATK